MKTSDLIKAKLQAAGLPYTANDNISAVLEANDIEFLQAEVEERVQELLEALVIDTENDHNTNETAKRVAKMFMREVYRGRYDRMPKVTDFPNAKDLDQIYTIGPISVRSACSHHLVPIVGNCWIGVLPSDRVIGISKFVRLAEWIMARPQIQEESTVQLADLIEEMIKPKGLAVVVEAQHMCMTWRGVREAGTKMTTSVMRGVFREDSKAREEFLKLIGK
jgi:GTP cyclohydrolase I